MRVTFVCVLSPVSSPTSPSICKIINQMPFGYFCVIAAAASEQGSNHNFVLWVEIKIFYLVHCMMVPVNFDRGAARSGIR